MGELELEDIWLGFELRSEKRRQVFEFEDRVERYDMMMRIRVFCL